jgi:hypothetical protein
MNAKSPPRIAPSSDTGRAFGDASAGLARCANMRNAGRVCNPLQRVPKQPGTDGGGSGDKHAELQKFRPVFLQEDRPFVFMVVAPNGGGLFTGCCGEHAAYGAKPPERKAAWASESIPV